MTERPYIPYSRPLIDDDDIAAVVAALKSPMLTQGNRVEAFEAAVAEVAGTAHAIAVANGSVALRLAYAVAGIGPGDEIVTSPITFVATANAAIELGATVRFADVDPTTVQLDPASVEAVIGPRTKAVVPVDFAGAPCDLAAFRALADRHGLALIVDGAHSFGATRDGRPTGGLADMTTYSFHAIKTVTTAEGGAVVTDDPDLAARLRLLRTHGVSADPATFSLPEQAADAGLDTAPGDAIGPDATSLDAAPWYYEQLALGVNGRLTDVQCALGLSQIAKLPMFAERRRRIAAVYDAAFADMPAVRSLTPPTGVSSAWHLYVVRLDLDAMTRSRRQVVEDLRALGIGAHVHYIPVHLQPYHRVTSGTAPGDCPNAEAYYRQAVTLPLHPGMTDDDVAAVVDAVRRFVC